MKKRNLIVLLISLLIIIIVIGIFSYPKNKVYSHPCDSKEYNLALEKLDINLCESVPNEPGSAVKYPYYDNYCREMCMSAIANKKQDPEICELINNIKDIPHVEGWDDPRETGSVKDRCYRFLAEKLNDVSLCDKVETNWSKKVCPQLVELKN